jgi:hypothetical protein
MSTGAGAENPGSMALEYTNGEEMTRALRNGRQARKELIARRRSHLFTPLSATALEQLLA